MKKYIPILFLIFQVSFAQEKNIPKDQMKSIRYEYNWKEEEEFLIINYRFPQDYCPYENYTELERTYNWLNNKVYSKVDMTNIRNIFIYDDKLAAKPILDNTTHYDDIGRYFLKNFFDKKGSCIGLLIINKKGAYKSIIGEYSSKDINNLTEALKIK
ncbi:hypothetical protein FIA58_001415 [Flavobacterium jejuense]|uniref:DUF4136 domain-containing protein n=1 Tax=Flavobacterium jejuense TaxID=1544455 RepID=A0ABX0INF1_9FLAO|nr:hypothetical protein [Flavobacterium jejuense]NHN24319.1 hypothetical protein [Flavobacterium jejuense]